MLDPAAERMLKDAAMREIIEDVVDMIGSAVRFTLNLALTCFAVVASVMLVGILTGAI